MPRVPDPDPAATVLALRPLATGFEVLMVHRNSRGFFRDIVVFPGGRVDEVDVVAGGEGDDERSHRNAALREFAEETGILITEEGAVRAPKARDHAYYDWLRDHAVAPGVDRLTLVSRWVTPEFAPRRFDTRFYVVSCQDAPDVELDEDELIWHEWVAPDAALQRHVDGEWPMVQPTVSHLQWLSRWATIEEAIRSAEGADGRTLIVPRGVDDGSLLPIHMPVAPT
jgi:8-oxo-dGTP pyrophosphatase MutT (NUDIX family)